MFAFGPKSLAKLEGVHPDLVRVLKLAISQSPLDWMILEGVRTVERQHSLYGQGRSVAQLRAKGVDPRHSKPTMQTVTWTLNSNHFAGRAVDVVPYPVDWNDVGKFDAIAKCILAAAEELGIRVRHGHDWDMDGVRREKGEADGPHFEIV